MPPPNAHLGWKYLDSAKAFFDEVYSREPPFNFSDAERHFVACILFLRSAHVIFYGGAANLPEKPFIRFIAELRHLHEKQGDIGRLDTRRAAMRRMTPTEASHYGGEGLVLEGSFDFCLERHDIDEMPLNGAAKQRLHAYMASHDYLLGWAVMDALAETRGLFGVDPRKPPSTTQE